MNCDLQQLSLSSDYVADPALLEPQYNFPRWKHQPSIFKVLLPYGIYAVKDIICILVLVNVGQYEKVLLRSPILHLRVGAICGAPWELKPNIYRQISHFFMSAWLL